MFLKVYFKRLGLSVSHIHNKRHKYIVISIIFFMLIICSKGKTESDSVRHGTKQKIIARVYFKGLDMHFFLDFSSLAGELIWTCCSPLIVNGSLAIALNANQLWWRINEEKRLQAWKYITPNLVVFLSFPS